MEFWLINTIDNEYRSSDKYITTTLEDAEAHRMEYCGWYCHPGDVDIRRVDQNFHELEHIHYWQGKVWEHYKVGVDDQNKPTIEYLVKNGKKVRSKK